MKSDTRSGQKPLTVFRVAFLYFGVLMGAGFASGKEMWQFFGVFGFKGLFGLLMIAFLFVALGLVIVHIGNALSTGDLIIGIIAAAFLFMAYFAMLAAGGALIEAQFGVPRVAGSTVLMFLVVLTTVKGFGTVSARQGKVVPILLAATLSMALIILFREFGSIEGKPAAGASPLAPNWIIAAVVFVSYNMMGAIPILGSCTVYAEDLRIVKRGAALGGSFLGTCALILYLVTLTDPILSSESDLPMLAFAQLLVPAAGALYSVVLLISVFGTATSCFYGYCTKLPKNDRKTRMVWASALAGLAVSMMGFSNIVAFIYPLQGYMSFVFLTLMIWNFVRIKSGKRQFIEEDVLS
ncbi:MAG TPA: hypothetical protein DCK81_01960 [Clostridiales bacterium UBA9856]|nr:hypothetical protein [Clostridiales bacterium UBA9856]